MAEVQNLDRLMTKLTAMQQASANPVVIVSYSQSYAVFVHESLQAHHPVGQAKFLEQPARELAPELGTMVANLLKRGMTLTMALLMAGLRLQRESQLLCPVDTGALKGSASTRVENE